MSDFSNREFNEMVRVYLLSNESLSAAQRMYERESVPRLRAQGIRNPTVPNVRTILAANQRLLDYGQFRTPNHAIDVEDTIFDFFERDPRASTHRIKNGGRIKWKQRLRKNGVGLSMRLSDKIFSTDKSL